MVAHCTTYCSRSIITYSIRTSPFQGSHAGQLHSAPFAVVIVCPLERRRWPVACSGRHLGRLRGTATHFFFLSQWLGVLKSLLLVDEVEQYSEVHVTRPFNLFSFDFCGVPPRDPTYGATSYFHLTIINIKHNIHLQVLETIDNKKQGNSVCQIIQKSILTYNSFEI